MMKRGFVFPGVHGEPIHQKPGVYQGVPAEEYHRWNAVSNSSMGHALVRQKDLPWLISMSHYHTQEPLTETPEIRFGKFAHAGRFEFFTALKDYVTMPDLLTCDVDKDGEVFESPCKDASGKVTESRNAKMYKERVARFQGFHVGKQFVDQSEYSRQAKFLYALDCDETARAYFGNHGPATDYEYSICWKDRESGLLCKARIDCAQHSPIEIAPGQVSRAVIDLKSLDSVTLFPHSMATLGYHRQGAFYADGMKTITGHDYWPCAVPCERNRPFTVGARPLELSTVVAGRMQYRQILTAIAAAIESDKWPGPTLPPTWQVPPWALPETLIA